MDCNIFKELYDALNNFYLWIDQGSSYEMAYEQVFNYDTRFEQGIMSLQKALYIIAISMRFVLNRSEISEGMYRDINMAERFIGNLIEVENPFTEDEESHLLDMINDLQTYTYTLQ